MTLVASYWEYGDSILLGDLLVSSISKSKGSFHIPSVGYTDKLYSDIAIHHNAGLARKLYLFSGQLALGTAGSLIAAETVYKDIDENLPTGYIPRQVFFDFVNKLDYIGGLDLSLVGVFTDLEGTFTFRWLSREPKTLHIKSNYFEGSGKDYFISKFNLNSLPYNLEPLPSDSSPFAEALKKCVLLLGDEQVHGDPLQNYFGGGFELIVHDDGRLKFVSDFAIVFWVINYEKGKINEIFHKRNIIQQTYRDDILWISSTVYRSDDIDLRYKNEWRTELYALPPLHGRHTSSTIPLIGSEDFHSKTICNYFHVNILDTRAELTLVSILNSPDNDLFSFESTKEGIELAIKDDYFGFLSEKIEEFITNGES